MSGKETIATSVDKSAHNENRVHIFGDNQIGWGWMATIGTAAIVAVEAPSPRVSVAECVWSALGAFVAAGIGGAVEVLSSSQSRPVRLTISGMR